MKKLLLFISIFIYGSLAAQNLAEPFGGTEPARGVVIPYGRVSDALQGVVSNSNFVAQLAPLSISESGTEFETSFAVPVWWLNRQVLVRVGRATSAYQLYIDGRLVGFAASGATPVEFNVTKRASEGRHTLKIKLVDAEQNRVNSHSAQAPKVEDVAVICQPTIRVRDIICSTTINDAGEGIAEFAVAVKCDALNTKRAQIGYKIHLNDTTIVDRGYRDIALDMRREDTVRFMARIPKHSLWSPASAHMVTLELESRIDNRPVEVVCRKLGIRAADTQSNKFLINGTPMALRLANYDATKGVKEQLTAGVNGLVVPAYYATEQLLSECDVLGALVFVQAAIDTLTLGESIARGGNPSNDPFWLDTYLSFNLAAYYSTRHHPSVVGFALASGKTNGINIYESYLMLKRLENRLPIVYEGAGGEWCSDIVSIR